MHKILKNYYHIDYNLNKIGYFTYNTTLYYITTIKDQKHFSYLYSIYSRIIHILHIPGYKLIPNIYENYYTKNYILMTYHPSHYSLKEYLTLCMYPLNLPPLTINQIKESWIHKNDLVLNAIQKYKTDNQEVIPYIHYYLGLAETSIKLLNTILSINPHTSIPLVLSLKEPIEYTDYELLNPNNYIISTKARMLTNLILSNIIQIKDITTFIPLLTIEELYYFYARFLYPSYHLNNIINCTYTIKDYKQYNYTLQKEITQYKEIYNILTTYISLPKIYWINT